MVYSPIGAWQVGEYESIRSAVEVVDDFLECAFDSAGYSRCVFEYNTTAIPVGAIIDSVSVAYSVFNNDPSIVDQPLTLQCYGGWAAPVPPDTTDATFVDGTLVGEDPIPPNVFPYSHSMTLLSDAVVKGGVTTLRFHQAEKSDEQYIVILAEGWPQLTVTYHMPARRRWPLRAAGLP